MCGSATTSWSRPKASRVDPSGSARFFHRSASCKTMLELENQTVYRCAGFIHADDGLATVAVRCTYRFGNGASWFDEQVDQLPIKMDEDHIGHPVADLFVVGHARPSRGASTVEVKVQLGYHGSLGARVFGRRVWRRRRFGGLEATPAEPIREPVPLTWAYAYGGRDYPYNPVGMGYVKDCDPADIELPRLEHPNRLIRTWEDKPLPVAFDPLPPGSAYHSWIPAANRCHPSLLVSRERTTIALEGMLLERRHDSFPLRVPECVGLLIGQKGARDQALKFRLDAINIDATKRTICVTTRANVRLTAKRTGRVRVVLAGTGVL